MHPALRKGSLFYKTPPFSTFFTKKHPPISFPAYGPVCVCPIRSPHAAAAGLLLWARRPRDIDRLLHRQQTAVVTRECHVVSWRRKVIIDLFNVIWRFGRGSWEYTRRFSKANTTLASYDTTAALIFHVKTIGNNKTMWKVDGLPEKFVQMLRAEEVK